MSRIALYAAALALAFAHAAFAAPAEQLSIRQPSPIDAVLTWQSSAGSPAGHIVEYINQPTDEWVILGFVPHGRNTFTHPNLAPRTPYAYRIRPFYGPTSPVVHVTIAEGLSDSAYAATYAQPEDYAWAPPRTLARPGEGVLARNSIRPENTRATAAPAALQAEIVTTTVSGFQLTWRDRSNDEEGFLLERLGDGSDFVVCAVLDPDINTFGWALEPPARQASFRIRAFFFGVPSNIVRITTGGASDEDPAPRRAGL